MYGQQGLQDFLFLMLYGGVAMIALIAGFYLLMRRANAIAPDVTPPTVLRRWTAVFFITAALSHMWWYALGVHWLTDDLFVRNIVAVTLDDITLIPLVMSMLLRMLQDRQRKVWPWYLAQIPILAAATAGIVTHSEFYGFDMMHYWQLLVIIVFVVYYIHALKHYGHWLRENYADLEHKELWKSLLFVIVLFIFFEVYTTNAGQMLKEYLSQLITIVIVAFLLWRVETLQKLEVKEDPIIEPDKQELPSVSVPSGIGSLLHKYCERRQLYLQHDLTLTQLCEKIGTNRTYLSLYFSQQNITYNAYVNGLRINHFERLYREAMASLRSITAQQLAYDSGFKSYSTFSAAFKQIKGQTVTEWIRQQGKAE